MNPRTIKFLTAPLFCILTFILSCTLFAQPAAAAITSASVTPSSRSIFADHGARVSLVWNIRTNGGLSKTVDVDDGEYLVNGAQVDTTPSLISQTKTSAFPANFFTFTFTETITIPQSLITQAKESGQPLVYHRSFSDDGFVTNRDLYATFYLTAGIGGALEISRIQLAFDDGSSLCTTKAGKDIHVKAFVDTYGTGVLRGNWQVRGDADGGMFRTVKTVQLPSSAGRKMEIVSPALPLDGNSRMDIRFEITSPTTDFDAPIVSCIVSGQDKILRKAPALIGKEAKVTSPRPFQPLTPSTQISWQAVTGAKAYRIEILDEKDGDPVSSQEVGAQTLSLKPSPLVLEKLDSHSRYLVRVIAIE